MNDPGARGPGTRGNGSDDPTRDIRWPPAPGSPPQAARPSDGPPASPQPTRAQRLADQPTDQLHPPAGRPRQATLKFDHPSARATPPAAPAQAPAQAPAPAPGWAGGSRRLPWALLVLLPVVIIVGSGIWLLFLLSHG